jgi:hypothetical protein
MVAAGDPVFVLELRSDSGGRAGGRGKLLAVLPTRPSLLQAGLAGEFHEPALLIVDLLIALQTLLKRWTVSELQKKNATWKELHSIAVWWVTQQHLSLCTSSLMSTLPCRYCDHFDVGVAFVGTAPTDTALVQCARILTAASPTSRACHLQRQRRQASLFRCGTTGSCRRLRGRGCRQRGSG